MRTIEEELKENGFVAMTNKGVSMMPLLRQGRDVMVIVSQTEGFAPRDAALFRRDDGSYVMHRVMRCEPDGYRIRGDNCIADEFVRADQMLGRLTAVIRDGKEIPVTALRYRCYVRSLPLIRAWRKGCSLARRAVKKAARLLRLSA